MDGSKRNNIPPEMAYPPPSFNEGTLNPNIGYYSNQGVHGSLPQYGVQNPQGAQTVVTALPTVYVTQSPLNTRVPDYLVYSIFTMLCCCLPLGIAGLIYSIRTRDANNQGQRELAEKSSRTTWILNSIGLAIGIAVTITWIVILTVYRIYR